MVGGTLKGTAAYKGLAITPHSMLALTRPLAVSHHA